MLDFLGYMLFSMFDYMSLLFVTFSIFNIDFRRSIKEAAIVSFILVMISYLIIIANLTSIIPIPLVMFGIIIGMLMWIIGVKRWKYSIIVTVGGLLLYLIMQAGTGFTFIYFNVITAEDLNNPFSMNTYIIQTLYSSLSIIIGIYTKIVGNGFGFVLRKGKALSFLLTSIALFSTIFLCWLGYHISKEFSLIIMVSIVAVTSAAIFYFLSHRRDRFEFS